MTLRIIFATEPANAALGRRRTGGALRQESLTDS